jgi:hypothetical protein
MRFPSAPRRNFIAPKKNDADAMIGRTDAILARCDDARQAP